MKTSVLLAAAAFGVGLCIAPAAADEYYSRRSDVWWGSSSGYAGSPYDEYSYAGIRWYGDCGYYGYDRGRHGKGYGHRRHRDHQGHRRRHHRSHDRDDD